MNPHTPLKFGIAINVDLVNNTNNTSSTNNTNGNVL